MLPHFEIYSCGVMKSTTNYDILALICNRKNELKNQSSSLLRFHFPTSIFLVVTTHKPSLGIQLLKQSHKKYLTLARGWVVPW